MPSLISCAEAGFEPIQGYVLREKLGAGGYGEVWLADAPGGLKKAIKFVFGSLDESRAASELKALQRIRQVTHPFLLSLERIEIVESQLVIVTELADGSLCDRHRKCRSDGYAGIPRDQLLDYLRDAADALDFLCQKHDLQHLDVKPANMLLVADRVKVADFGLIKDIQANSMSMLGGMTPTYAAPEMFDGRPGRFSDQYSLAIVYQELLTGTLPFGGRTTAQLASEHLHRAPNLDPVPPADRPILAKALAKKASQRYASCREFIDQLIAGGQSKPEQSAHNGPHAASHEPNVRARPAIGKVDSPPPSNPKTASIPLRSSTQAYEKRPIQSLPPIDLARNSGAEGHAPSFFIGLGRTGAEILTGLRSELSNNGIDVENEQELTWLLLDTDGECIKSSTSDTTPGHMRHEATLHIPLKPSQYYRECDEVLFTPISRRWLYNVPRSRTTEGVRPLGMLALLDHADQIHRAIQNYVNFLQRLLEESEKPKRIRVYLLASAHGGTGSSLVSEIGFLVRRELEERGLEGIIQAFLTVGEQSELLGSELQSATAVACLSELSHYIQSGGLHPGLPSLPPSQAVCKAPVDNVYLVHGGTLGDRTAWITAIDQTIEYVMADACTSLGTSLDALRLDTHENARTMSDIAWTPWLRTLCSRRIDISSRLNPDFIANMATFQAAQRWMLRFRSNLVEPTLDPNSQGDVNSQAQAQRKKVLEQIDFMVSDLFRSRRWTAQAWLSRCMEMLMQDNHVPFETNLLPLDSPKSPLLEEEVVIEIERIAERLAVDLSQCKFDASNLLDSTMDDFTNWLNQAWMKSQFAWPHLATMLGMIAQRFQEQGVGLRNVSHRFRAEHDAILERLYANDHQATPSETESEMVELDRLEVQARLHEFAGRMLVRIANYIETLRECWRSEANKLLKELGESCAPLAEQLDVCLSPQGFLREPMMPVPSEWEPVRKLVDEQVDEQIAIWAAESLSNSCGKGNVFSEETDESSKEETPSTTDVTQTSFPGNESSPATVTLAEKTLQKECRLKRLHSWLQLSLATATAHCEGLSLSWTKPSVEPNATKRSNSIAKQVRESSPTLLQWGGAKRNLLLLPQNCPDDVDAKWRAMFTESISILRMQELSTPLVLCDAEQLILPEVLFRMWRMASEKQNLIMRVESRCDVEWIPIVS